MENRVCLTCGKLIRGRSDKKFCDDYCRNNFNNRLKANNGYSPYVRSVNHALLKNRKILESILPVNEDTTKATMDKLQRLGFHFKYMTHTYTNRAGKTYFFCYDYGYMPLDKDWFLVVKKKDE